MFFIIGCFVAFWRFIFMSVSLLPELDCDLCPRLKAFRDNNKEKYPDFYNAPVMPFGSLGAELLIIGLAPGLKGANQTGRPFTGDYAGDLLYKMLLEYDLATGTYQSKPDDNVVLTRAYITNAVKCVPPQNKPVGAEINACRPFLISELENMKSLKAVLCLGRISHEQTLRVLGLKLRDYKFGHGATYDVPLLGDEKHQIRLFDSYHCSRYNTNTGRLTEEMFRDIFSAIKLFIDSAD
jgi:uracil-DNA glycosylase family 4